MSKLVFVQDVKEFNKENVFDPMKTGIVLSLANQLKSFLGTTNHPVLSFNLYQDAVIIFDTIDRIHNSFYQIRNKIYAIEEAKRNMKKIKRHQTRRSEYFIREKRKNKAILKSIDRKEEEKINEIKNDFQKKFQESQVLFFKILKTLERLGVYVPR